MNVVNLVGRLTRDVETKFSQSNNSMAIARFSLAVDRRPAKDGTRQADFISCVAFGKTAEFVGKYFSKGQRMGLRGHIQTGNYDKPDGTKVYTTDVIVDEVEFVESKRDGNNGSNYNPTASNESFNSNSGSDDFMKIPDTIEEELPFN